METTFTRVIPVLPSADIERDIAWYQEKAGFKTYFSDKMYAVIFRENICLHLQWHANTEDDPLLGGSVIRMIVENIEIALEEYVNRGTVTREKLKYHTPWGTHEFGFYDLNNNAIFIMQDL